MDVDRIRGYTTLKHLFKKAAGDVIFRHDPKTAIVSLVARGNIGRALAGLSMGYGSG